MQTELKATIAGERVRPLRSRVAPRPPGLRFRLRDATAADHARLDTLFSSLDLRKSGDYRRFLEVTAAALIPLEEALGASGVNDTVPDWPQRSRTAALRSDLSRLGGSVDPLPPVTTPDRDTIFGVLYVLEGSRLGARVLLPIVLGSDDLRVATTNAYLSHGLERPLWQSFVATLERHGETIADDDGVIAGATLAFDLFARAAARA
jgi:heme oxygenase